MHLQDARDAFMTRMNELCALLGIPEVHAQAGEAIAYRLDLDETSFTLQHSTASSPTALHIWCSLGTLPAEQPEAAMAALLRANRAFASENLGAFCLESPQWPGDVVFVSRMNVADAAAEILDALLRIRSGIRDWSESIGGHSSAAETATGSHARSRAAH